MSCHIITGTSGTGKSVLIEELQRRGYVVFEEAQRAVLSEQLETDGPALPSKDPAKFIDALLQHCVACLKDAQNSNEPSFFDRGIPDVAAYALRFGVDPANCYAADEIQAYNRRVFVLPPWQEIFVSDPLRGQSFEQYEAFHATITKCYEDLGFELVGVPVMSIERRADFILDTLSLHTRRPQ